MLYQIRKFYCISRTILIIALIYLCLSLFLFFTYVLSTELLDVVWWMPVIFACIYYVFAVSVGFWFMSMGYRFLHYMKKDGYEVNIKLSVIMFALIQVVCMFGWLNFSFVQLVNQLNFSTGLKIPCVGSPTLLVVSSIISYSYMCGPFL